MQWSDDTTFPSPKRLGLTEAYRNDRGVMMAAGTVQLFLFQVATRSCAGGP